MLISKDTYFSQHEGNGAHEGHPIWNSRKGEFLQHALMASREKGYQLNPECQRIILAISFYLGIILVHQRQGLCGKVQAMWHQLHVQFSGFKTAGVWSISWCKRLP